MYFEYFYESTEYFIKNVLKISTEYIQIFKMSTKYVTFYRVLLVHVLTLRVPASKTPGGGKPGTLSTPASLYKSPGTQF